ncbi:MAG: carboxypeptidase-like regulatory domain-containing protein, partial [Candidatus Cybelea sp.]
MRTIGRILSVLFMLAISLQRAGAAELITGAILGTVSSTSGSPIANARVSAFAPSGRYTGTTDAGGHFTILGVAPDTYAVSVEASGFEPANATVIVLPGDHARLSVV